MKKHIPTKLLLPLVLVLAACAEDERGADPTGDVHPNPTACGKCDGPGGQFPAAEVPAEAAVYRLFRAALRDDGRLDAEEADRLAAFTRRHGGLNERVATWLGSVPVDDASAPAAEILRRAALGERDDVPLENGVYRVVPGPQPFLFDDALYLLGEGRVEGDTGLESHSRGYAAKRDGVLFTRHGSPAPHHALTSTPAETERLRALGPDAVLDAAARTSGISLDEWSTFSRTARDSNFYAPGDDTPYWAGICQGWTHNSLDDRINALVDVEGTEGARGVWIFGQWISRADLGNAMMGASYSLGIADSDTIDSFVTPESLVKALAQYVLRSGKGLRVDIWNDAHNQTGGYSHQIWNQPIVSGSVEVARVEADTEAAVLGHAGRGEQVRLVRATAVWGAEANDEWEEGPLFRESEWNLYLVAGADGRVLGGFTADELAAEGVSPLPVVESDGLPDYIAVPRHELTDAALERRPHRLLDPQNGEGARFRFLVGTVLARGVTEPERAAFEAAFASGTPAATLSSEFPGVANAYSPEQWDRVFAATLGPGAGFGAVWAAR